MKSIKIQGLSKKADNLPSVDFKWGKGINFSLVCCKIRSEQRRQYWRAQNQGISDEAMNQFSYELHSSCVIHDTHTVNLKLESESEQHCVPLFFLPHKYFMSQTQKAQKLLWKVSSRFICAWFRKVFMFMIEFINWRQLAINSLNSKYQSSLFTPSPTMTEYKLSGKPP